MFKGLIDTIIGNLQLSISNIHVRYEVIEFILYVVTYMFLHRCSVPA